MQGVHPRVRWRQGSAVGEVLPTPVRVEGSTPGAAPVPTRPDHSRRLNTQRGDTPALSHLERSGPSHPFAVSHPRTVAPFTFFS